MSRNTLETCLSNPRVLIWLDRKNASYKKRTINLDSNRYLSTPYGLLPPTLRKPRSHHPRSKPDQIDPEKGLRDHCFSLWTIQTTRLVVPLSTCVGYYFSNSFLRWPRSKEKARKYYNIGPYIASEVAAKAEARKKDIHARLQLKKQKEEAEKQRKERKEQEKLRKKVTEERQKSEKMKKWGLIGCFRWWLWRHREQGIKSWLLLLFSPSRSVTQNSYSLSLSFLFRFTV